MCLRAPELLNPAETERAACPLPCLPPPLKELLPCFYTGPGIPLRTSRESLEPRHFSEQGPGLLPRGRRVTCEPLWWLVAVPAEWGADSSALGMYPPPLATQNLNKPTNRLNRYKAATKEWGVSFTTWKIVQESLAMALEHLWKCSLFHLPTAKHNFIALLHKILGGKNPRFQWGKWLQNIIIWKYRKETKKVPHG